MAEKSVEQLQKMVQRALDYQEIQNVFSRHAYYHAVWKHKEEIEKIWAHKTPGVSFETDQIGRIEGFEAVKTEYADTADEDGQRHLEQMIKVFPEIENKPENRWIGMAVMHTLTTPVIEVAEDGKTAKGVWVAPGHITMPRDDKMQASWFWERYGVDFVKEDGEWKIWHFRVYTDFMTPYEKSWAETSMEPRAPVPPRGRKPANVPPTWPPYKSYSPFNVPQYQPRPPEPYKTFSETFSY
jgi:hypothetical protein